MIDIEAVAVRKDELKGLLNDLLEAAFKNNPQTPDWRGTRLRIMQEVFANPFNASLLSGMKTSEMDEALCSFEREGFFKLRWENNRQRQVVWIFSNPGYAAPPTLNEAAPATTAAPVVDSLAERKLALAERQAAIAERQVTLAEQQQVSAAYRNDLALKKERRLFERDAAKRLLRLNSPAVLEATKKAREAQEYAEKAAAENPMVGDILPWTDKGAVVYNEAWFQSRIGLLQNWLQSSRLEVKRLEAIVEAGGLQP